MSTIVRCPTCDAVTARHCRARTCTWSTCVACKKVVDQAGRIMGMS